MRVLLDHNFPHPLRHRFPGHDVVTARYLGWDRPQNGDLWRAAETGFDVVITIDAGFRNHQAVAKFDLAVVVLRTKSNRIPVVEPLLEQTRELLDTCQPGRLYVVEA